MKQQPGEMASPALQKQQPQRQPAQAQAPQHWQQQQPNGAAPPNAAPVPGGSEEVRSLWIGDIPYWIDEAYLTKHYSYCYPGELVSVKVIHNKHTPFSKGYGFLEFRSWAAAELVLLGHFLMPFSFRMNWDLGAPTDNEHTIFVGNLAHDVTDYILQETFKVLYQSVKGSKVITDKVTGCSKGYGFVTFWDEKEQQRAMTEMNGVFCLTRQMRVGPAASKKPMFVAPTPTHSVFAEQLGEMAPPAIGMYQQQHQPAQASQFWQQQQQQPFGSASANAASFPGGTKEDRSLWIGGLQYWMDEAYLASSYQIYLEKPVSVKVIRNKQTNKSEGYGFLEFRSRAAAESVLKRINRGLPMPYTDPEQRFQMNWASLGARGKRIDNPEHTIFVGDLAGDVTDYILYETFENMYQSVKGAKVVVDRVTGRSKGYGFVTFGDEKEQQRAMTEMNGVFCSTRQMRVGPAANTKPMSAAPTQSGEMAPLALGNDQQKDTPQEQQNSPRDCFEYRWIGNIEEWMNEQYLTNFFNNCEIVSAKILRNNQTFLYGLLEFSSSRAASAARSFSHSLDAAEHKFLLKSAGDAGDAGDEHEIFSRMEEANKTKEEDDKHHQMLSVTLCEGLSDPNNTTIFVGDLDPSVSEHKLKQVFSQFGELVHVKIPVGKRRRMLVDQIVCKCCGFVQFVDRSCAKQALSSLNGTMLGRHNIRLSWALGPLIQQMDIRHRYRPDLMLGGANAAQPLDHSLFDIGCPGR